MEAATKQKWFYTICLLFILVNAIAIATDMLWINALPALMIIAFLFLYKLDWLILVLVFLIPLSVNVNDIGFGLGISLPNEPLIMLITAVALFRFLIHSQYDYSVFRHPITIALTINLLWVFISCFASEYPFVSFKYFLSRCWFIVVFYFLGIALFKKFSQIHTFLWLYVVPLCVVIAYTLWQHKAYNFSQQYSFTIMQPFYVGHGVYAAAIAFFIPLLFIYLCKPSLFFIGPIAWTVILAILSFLLIGLFYSYTRAAWISIVAAILALVPLALRIRLRTLLVGIVVFTALGILFSNQLIYLMSRNQDESSKDFSEHINSISNIKTDASNAERINRWVCAIELFKERPVVGWGPGTYKFVYAPFQMAKYRTIISTNFGDNGNAHSEYLNPLAEMGLLGMLTLLYLVYVVLNTGFQLVYTAQNTRVKYTALAILLGLITYFVHGLMNNYSETDKIAVLYWGAFGMLAALDLYHKQSEA
jgi:putative inorganic carbon (hco3(-)) transporter